MFRHRARRFAVGAITALAIAITLVPAAAASSKAAPTRAASTERGSGLNKGALMVKLHPGTTDAAASALFRKHGITELGRVDQLGTRVVVGRDKAPALLRRALRASPDVASVEEDGEVSITMTPTDPLWANEWFARRVRAPRAWDTTIGASGPVVAVLDTGVQFSHPDLSGRLLSGHDFVNNDSNPVDDNGHGTAVSGVVAGAGMNGVGVAGMCWRCRVLPLKVANSQGNVRWSNVVAAIVWAADRGVAAINMSFGGPVGSSSAADAITYARNRGVVVIAAAGNNGSSAKFYPAALPGVISVAGTNTTDNLYSWSNRGSWVKLAAPGCTWTSRKGSTWSSFCGTSAAAPVVAGIAGLVRANRPNATRAQVEAALLSTAARVTPAIGGGRVDAAAAVEVGSAPAPTPDPTPDPVPTISACPNQERSDAGGSMSWQRRLGATRMSVACTVELEGWTRLEMSWWNSAAGVRLTLRDEDGKVVAEMGGWRHRGGDGVERWLSRGLYRLTVRQLDAGTARFIVRITWRHD